MSFQEIQARTIGGVCYLSAADVAKALRLRAEETSALADALGDDPYGSGFVEAVSYRSVALELQSRADALEFGVIELLTEQPGDSDLTDVVAE